MAALLNRIEAAKYIKEVYCIPCSRMTLAKYAVEGTGPTYRRLSNKACLYRKEDLDEWAMARLSEPQTKSLKRPPVMTDEARFARMDYKIRRLELRIQRLEAAVAKPFGDDDNPDDGPLVENNP